MALDPIHTIRAAERLHLKDAIFVSFAPLGVAAGHLRAVNGTIAWIGASSAVERGEDVLECWRQIVIPGLPLAGLSSFRIATRALPNVSINKLLDWFRALPRQAHKTLALQMFTECAANGVLLPIVDLNDAPEAVVLGVRDAAEESGLRAILQWNGNIIELERVHSDSDSRIRLIESYERNDVLQCGGAAFDTFTALRSLPRGEQMKYLSNTYSIFSKAFSAPFGTFTRGAFFDVVFLDYEIPGKLDADNVFEYIVSAFSASQVEACAVATNPVVRRHEVLTVDRAAVAHDATEILASAPSG